MLRDRRWHQPSRTCPSCSGIDIAELTGQAGRRPGILAAEGEEHSRLRRLVAPAFTPKAADRLRPYMREVDQPAHRPGRGDGPVRARRPTCASPIRSRSSASCSARPRRTGSCSAGGPRDLLRIFDGDFMEELPTIIKSQDEMREYVQSLVERRRSKPGRRSAHRPHRGRGGRRSPRHGGPRGHGDRGARRRHRHDAQPARVHASRCSPSYPEQWRLLGERPELAAQATEESMRVLGADPGHRAGSRPRTSSTRTCCSRGLVHLAELRRREQRRVGVRRAR